MKLNNGKTKFGILCTNLFRTQMIWHYVGYKLYILRKMFLNVSSSQCSDTDRGFFETKRVLTMH